MVCTADVPWGIDAEGSLEIFVTRIRDLNEEIETLETVEEKEEFRVGWGCFSQGPITLDIKLPKSGFVCGERAKVTANVSKINCSIGCFQDLIMSEI